MSEICSTYHIPNHYEYFGDRKFNVKNRNNKSNIKEIAHGVPQGSVSGNFCLKYIRHNSLEKCTFRLQADDMFNCIIHLSHL